MAGAPGLDTFMEASAPLAYSVKAAAKTLSISRSRFYELVAAGEILVLKEGARSLVRRSELVAYLERLERRALEVASAKAAQRR